MSNDILNHLSDILKIFLGFILANIVLIYINDAFKKRDSKKDYDVLLANKLLDVFNQKEFNDFMNSISSGQFYRQDLNKFVSLLETDVFNQFYDKKINKQFKLLIKKLNNLYEFYCGKFSSHHAIENLILYDKKGSDVDQQNLNGLLERAEKCKIQFNILINSIKSKYPLVFSSKDRIIIDVHESIV